jgi:hypothetical protein
MRDSSHTNTTGFATQPVAGIGMVRRMAFVDWLGTKMGDDCRGCGMRERPSQFPEETVEDVWEDDKHYESVVTTTHLTCGHSWTVKTGWPPPPPDLSALSGGTSYNPGSPRPIRPTERINELKRLFDNGLITHEEFEEKRKAIVDEV